MKYNIITYIIFLLCINIANSQEIKIISDKLELNRNKNNSTFTGNVYANDKNLEIWSDKLVITSSKDEKTIETVIAKNNVKILREQIVIQGNEANYNPTKELLVVIGEVKVAEDNNIIFCDELIIDLINSTSIMKSKSAKRVEAVIFNEVKK